MSWLLAEQITLDLDFLNIEENLSHQFLSFFGIKIGVLIDLDNLDTGLEGGKNDIRGGAIETVSCAMGPSIYYVSKRTRWVGLGNCQFC